MGSSYFYLEYLVAWATALKARGFKNPAVLALEYTLVPDAVWPKQYQETEAGYKFLTESMGMPASRICLAGDSAGATLIMSLLLHKAQLGMAEHERPGFAILISPWTHLVSDMNQNTPSDYLDRDSLHLYARQYARKESLVHGDIISPGLSRGYWRKAAPIHGFYIMHGAEEVFAPGIQETVKNMKLDGADVTVYREPAGIHAWPVVNLFLGESRDERLKGLDLMSEYVSSRAGVGLPARSMLRASGKS